MVNSLIQTNRIVMIPLQDNYTIIQERVSNLETFMTCPFKYFAEPEYIVKEDGTPMGHATADYFKYGHLMHTVVQQYCVHTDKEKAMEVLLLYPEYKDIILPYFEAIHPLGLESIASNVKVFCEIEAGPYLLCLTGEFDMLVKDLKMKAMIDLKFPQGEWKEDKVESLRQKILYPFLFGEERGYDDLSEFRYLIMTKHQKGGIPRPRLQQFIYKIDKEEVRRETFRMIKLFLTARHTSTYDQKGSDACYMCRLKSQNQCPMWI